MLPGHTYWGRKDRWILYIGVEDNPVRRLLAVVCRKTISWTLSTVPIRIVPGNAGNSFWEPIVYICSKTT